MEASSANHREEDDLHVLGELDTSFDEREKWLQMVLEENPTDESLDLLQDHDLSAVDILEEFQHTSKNDGYEVYEKPQLQQHEDPFTLSDNLPAETSHHQASDPEHHEKHLLSATSPDDLDFLDHVDTQLNVSTPKVKKRRDRESWDSNEQHKFFLAVERLVLDESFENISKSIGTKTAQQCREYYFNILEHLNVLLKSYKVHIFPEAKNEIRVGLLSWYKVCCSYAKKELQHTVRLDRPDVRHKFAAQLHTVFTKSLQTDSEVNLNSNKNKRIRPTTKENPGAKKNLSEAQQPSKRLKRPPVSDSESSVSPPPSSSSTRKPRKSPQATPSQRLRLRLMPMDTTSKRVVSEAGLSSKLELNLQGSKKVSDVWKHVAKKWDKAIQASQRILRFIPLGDRIHPGWSVDDISISCLDIWKQYGSNQHEDHPILALEYKFDLPSQRSPSAPVLQERPRNDGVLTPLAMPVELQKSTPKAKKQLASAKESIPESLLDSNACYDFLGALDSLDCPENFEPPMSYNTPTPKSMSSSKKSNLRRIKPTLVSRTSLKFH